MGSHECNNLCLRYKSFVAMIGSKVSYSNGYKRCTECRKAIITNSHVCSCCGQRLKFKARNKQYKSEVTRI